MIKPLMKLTGWSINTFIIKPIRKVMQLIWWPIDKLLKLLWWPIGKLIKKLIIAYPFLVTRSQAYARRQLVIKLFFGIFLVTFVVRIPAIYQLHDKGISIQDKASQQAGDSYHSVAHRGDILDRNGVVLASSLILKKVNLDVTVLQPEYISALAKALMMPEKKFRKIIKEKRNALKGRRYLIIKNNIRLTSPILTNLKELGVGRYKDYKKNRKIVCLPKERKELGLLDKLFIFLKIKPVAKSEKSCLPRWIGGVALESDKLRYYPKSASLAPLLGRVNRNGKGASGIEGEFESALSGVDGIKTLSYNQKSQRNYFNFATQKELKHGQNINLTIDADIQYHTYAAIKKSVKKHEADSGSAIVLNPQGEVLALVNYPTDDPNDKTIYHIENYRNRVLSDRVEPGSTMKPFTMLLALDKGKITATDDEVIDVTKSIGHLKYDGKYSKMTVKKILQKSHNLGTVNISERLKKEEMYDTWNKLGFGHSLGLIPSIETSGILKLPYLWSKSDKRTLSYGYGPMQTNLAQLARAYLVFANEGAVPPLKLIKNTLNYGETTQVFSKESTSKIASLLDSVVSKGGSGYRAQIKGYNIAGKTGTAEMLINNRYNQEGKKRTFFVGFTPVKKPKYIMAIRLDYPKKCYASWDPNIKLSCEGSNSAAMVFKDAMKNILNSDPSVKLLTKK